MVGTSAIKELSRYRKETLTLNRIYLSLALTGSRPLCLFSGTRLRKSELLYMLFFLLQILFSVILFLSAVNYFLEMLHLRCLTGFRIRFWYLIQISFLCINFLSSVILVSFCPHHLFLRYDDGNLHLNWNINYFYHCHIECFLEVTCRYSETKTTR